MGSKWQRSACSNQTAEKSIASSLHGGDASDLWVNKNADSFE